MSFENPDLSEIVEKTQEAGLTPEVSPKEIELTPAMQELYEEITAEKVDENQLESEAKKMSTTERLGVLGKAIERAGKLARRIAVVAFAGVVPSLAGSADTAKQIENDLVSETNKEWQDVKVEKIKDSMKDEEKIARGYWAAIGQPIPDDVNVGPPPFGMPQFKAYEKGLFKNPAEFKQWHENVTTQRIKENMKKYPGALEELRANIDKFHGRTSGERMDYRAYLEEKYSVSGPNAKDVINDLESGILRSMNVNE